MVPSALSVHRWASLLLQLKLMMGLPSARSLKRSSRHLPGIALAIEPVGWAADVAAGVGLGLVSGVVSGVVPGGVSGVVSGVVLGVVSASLGVVVAPFFTSREKELVPSPAGAWS